MGDEVVRIRDLFNQLVNAPLTAFPMPRKKLNVPVECGVYVIYGRDYEVLHVGRTTHTRRGLLQRLKGHLAAKSSFVNNHYKGEAHSLRDGHSFRCLVVQDPRERALLEAYAIGCLCPLYIGLGSKRDA